MQNNNNVSKYFLKILKEEEDVVAIKIKILKEIALYI
jgi:hypothetical protein